MANDSLNVALIQSNLHWESIEDNLRMFEIKLSQIKAADLIILPEMFTTGFSMNTDQLAEEMDGESVLWMKTMALKYNSSIIGSLIIKEEGKYFNRLIYVNKNGNTQHYDKRHLFSLAKEEKHFHPGQSKLIIELNNWRLCLNICYDLRFPVWSRNKNEYDVLVYIANWPEKRSNHWSTLLKARAIENLSYVIGLNRVGEDGKSFYYSGDSAVVDPRGDVLAELVHDEGIIQLDLSKERLLEYRKAFGFLKDGDEFQIQF